MEWTLSAFFVCASALVLTPILVTLMALALAIALFTFWLYRLGAKRKEPC